MADNNQETYIHNVTIERRVKDGWLDPNYKYDVTVTKSSDKDSLIYNPRVEYLWGWCFSLKSAKKKALKDILKFDKKANKSRPGVLLTSSGTVEEIKIALSVKE